MLQRLIDALVASANEAADDLLLEALEQGNEQEQSLSMNALLKRNTTTGLVGVIERYSLLPEKLQSEVMHHIGQFHHALRECGRSEKVPLRLSAMRLIALGRQGKLSYVLSENLHHTDETISRSAIEALVALSRWVSVETRALQKMDFLGVNEKTDLPIAGSSSDANVSSFPGLFRSYHELIEQRPEIESAVARAIDAHRGRHGQELLRAALLLSNWSGSKTLQIIQTARHGGQSLMVRRLQQPPASEHVEAFLLGASHGGLRSHFGITFSQIDEAPVLDALLRKTHWLKDNQLQLCMHQVTRGTWFGDGELLRDIERRDPSDAARVGEWLAVSGMHDVTQDERMDRIREYAKDDFSARLRLFWIAARRKRGASVALFRGLMNDSDERLMRMAAREIVRRRPGDFENMLLPLMTTAPLSVRRVIARAVGQSGFEQFWARFDKLDRTTRKQAGRAMMKLLPDAPTRLSRKLLAGPIEHRLKALQITQEMKLAESLKDVLIQLCTDPNPKLRSKAISVLGDVPDITPDFLIERLMSDSDSRVRANAIEVLESKKRGAFVPLLVQRAQSASNRERANAIKALHNMKVGNFGEQLRQMLSDSRYEHRISAMWALRQMTFWPLLQDVVKMARTDENLRVRRYALGILRQVQEVLQAETIAKAG